MRGGAQKEQQVTLPGFEGPPLHHPSCYVFGTGHSTSADSGPAHIVNLTDELVLGDNGSLTYQAKPVWLMPLREKEVLLGGVLVRSGVAYFTTSAIDIMDGQTAELFLTESPLVSVSSVKEREGITSAYTTLVNNTDYYIDLEHDRLYRIDGDISSKNWAKGFASVEVIYRAGYSATPQDLRLAIYDLITYYLKEEFKGRKSLAGATLQNETSTSIREDIGFPDHIKRVLDMHRIVDVI